MNEFHVKVEEVIGLADDFAVVGDINHLHKLEDVLFWLSLAVRNKRYAVDYRLKGMVAEAFPYEETFENLVKQALNLSKP